MPASQEKATSIDLILAETEADRIYLEKMLGVSQAQMTDFFHTQFSKVGLLSGCAPQTQQQRLEAVRGVIFRLRNTT